MLKHLKRLVEIESPSDDKAAVDRAGEPIAEWAKALGGRVRVHPFPLHGNSLEIRFGSARSRNAPLMLLGHLDTVWAKGTLQQMPWRVLDDRICGPGVLDMKAGVTMMLTAIAILRECSAEPCPVVILLHGDEEIGSPASRSLTESTALTCRAVYVLEPAQGTAGAYKTARKGVGHYRITVRGVGAHSGVDFTAGHSAIVELAHQIERISRITNLERGITINPGVISGGSRSNVVASEAWTDVDVRVARACDAERVNRALRRLGPLDTACSLEVEGGTNRPPMERTRGTVMLFRHARALAARIGLPLEEAATGGGSDGNFASALGIPTLDGMGAAGAGAHAAHEHVFRRDLAARTALLAAMLL
ncbi:MAG: M20 family metallopeptidase [Acidobacteriaceae bacterium]